LKSLPLASPSSSAFLENRIHRYNIDRLGGSDLRVDDTLKRYPRKFVEKQAMLKPTFKN
jgi:hypothetical protein